MATPAIRTVLGNHDLHFLVVMELCFELFLAVVERGHGRTSGVARCQCHVWLPYTIPNDLDQSLCAP